MDGSKLTVFNWNTKLRYFLYIPSILALVLLFFIFGFFSYFIPTTNKWILGISYMSYMLVFSYAINIWMSTFVFKEIGWIYVSGNTLIVKSKSQTTIYTSNELKRMELNYLGDWEWRAKNEWYQKWKSKSRYYLRRNESNFQGRERFDSIVLNDVKLYIKIRDEAEKNQFFGLLNWAKDQKIEFKFWEAT